MFTNTKEQFSNNLTDSPDRANRRGGYMGRAIRALGLVLLTLGLSASWAEPASPRHIEVLAKRYAFVPADITVKKGEPVDFVLTSADVNHGVRIRELGLDLRVAKGKKAEITITPQSTGTFVGHCSVFCGSGHGQMTLTVHVVA